MTRKATQPLNPKALVMANAATQKQFSPTPQPGDPQYGAFRQAWMDAYIANGGAYTEETPQQAVQKAQIARTQTLFQTRTAGSTAPCPNTAFCGLPVLTASTVDCTCKLVDLEVGCEHGRKAAFEPSIGGKLLQVVSSNLNGDAITITPNAQGDCAEKLETRVSGIPARSLGETTFPHKGTSPSHYQAFGRKNPLASIATFRLTDTRLVSQIDAATCGGNLQTVQVEAFPSGVSKLKWNFAAFEDGVFKKFEKLPIDLRGFTGDGNARKKRWSNTAAPKGRSDPEVGLTGEVEWREKESSHLAYANCSLSLAADPFFGGDMKFPLISPVPPFLQGYVVAGLYLNLGGKLYFKCMIAWHWYPSPASEVKLGEAGGELGGEIELEIAGELFLISHKVGQVKVAGGTKLYAKGGVKGAPQKGVWLEGDIGWGGLTTKVVCKMLWGTVDVEREWPIMEGRSFKKGEYQVLDP